MCIYYNKYTINTYDINGKYTLTQQLGNKPMYFDSKKDAETYAKDMGLDLEEVSIEIEEVE